jgi:hypothetical protein
MTLNAQGYYECPKCHLQTVWVDKSYPYLWILRERGSGDFQDITHPELYSDVGAQNKEILGGFEFFINVLGTIKSKPNAGSKLKDNALQQYADFIRRGKAKSNTSGLNYGRVVENLKTHVSDLPEVLLKDITSRLAVHLENSILIRAYIDTEVEEMTQEKWDEIEANKTVTNPSHTVRQDADGTLHIHINKANKQL